MGLLRKLGVVILLYVILGVIFTALLLNDIVSIHDGNIFIDILDQIFWPIIFIANFLYVTMPFLP